MPYLDDPTDNPYSAPRADLGTDDDQAGHEPRLNYAGFGRRFVASIIDQAILFGLSLALRLVDHLVDVTLRHSTTPTHNIDSVLLIVLYIAYFAGMESSPSGATLGKLAMGIQVTDMQGGRISFQRALVRRFATFLSGCILYIGYIMAAFTEKKQALHDLIAGTLVIKGRSRAGDGV